MDNRAIRAVLSPVFQGYVVVILVKDSNSERRFDKPVTTISNN